MPEDIKDKILSGIDSLYQLEYDEAKTKFRYVAKNYRDRPIAYFYLAMVEWIKLSEDKNDETANKNFDYYINEAVKTGETLYNSKNATSMDIFYYAGALGFSARNTIQKHEWVKAYFMGKKALDLMDEAIEKDPNNYDAYLGRGMYHYFADRLPNFLKDVMKSFDIKGDAKKGLTELNMVAEKGLFAKTEAKALLVYIYTWYEKNFAKAMKITDELIKQYPNNLSFYHSKLYLYFGVRDFKNAQKVLATYKSVLKKMPKDEQKRWSYKYYFYVGRTLFEMGKYADCMKYFRKVIVLREKYLYTCRYTAWAMLRMGMCFDMDGNRDNALELYKQVIKTDIVGNTRTLAEEFTNKAFYKGDPRAKPSENKNAFIP